MKFLDTHCEDYIKSVDKYNLHPQLKKSFPDDIMTCKILFYMVLQVLESIVKRCMVYVNIAPQISSMNAKLNIRYGKNRTLNIVLKISGIWNNYNSCGLTFSLLYCQPSVKYRVITVYSNPINKHPNVPKARNAGIKASSIVFSRREGCSPSLITLPTYT